MGIRENKVERYLKQKVEEHGGISRKWVSPGHDGVPDQIVWMPGLKGMNTWLVEVKTEGGKYGKSQVREHFRLRNAGLNVRTVFGEQGVDRFIREAIRWPGPPTLPEEPGVYEATKCWGKQWEEFQQ